MSLSELENMTFLTNEALKDMPVEFDLDENGNQVAKISFHDAVTLFEKGYKYRDKEIEKLKQENKKIKDALGFYADIKNWERCNQTHFTALNRDKFPVFGGMYYGGKLARKTLKETEESK